MAPMTRGRPKEFVREDALECALGTFWDRGYASTGLGDLTRAMGIGRQSLYDTFGDKRSLYLEALEAYCDRQLASIRALVSAESSPGQGLAAFLRAWESMATGTHRNGCLVINSVPEATSGGDPEIIKALGRHVDRMGRLIEDLVQAAMDSGEITVPLKAREVAGMISAAVHGLSVRARLQDASLAAADTSRALAQLLGLS